MQVDPKTVGSNDPDLMRADQETARKTTLSQTAIAVTPIQAARAARLIQAARAGGLS